MDFLARTFRIEQMNRPKKTPSSRLLSVSLMMLVSFTAAFSQVKHPMKAEDVVGLKRATDAEISPDGHRVAFVVDSWDRESDRFNSDLWVAYDTREPSVQMTWHPKRDYYPRWAPDGRQLAFLSERAGDAADHSSSSTSNTQIF